MVRATRSSVIHESNHDDEQNTQKNVATKKRKRHSNSANDAEDQPAQKQPKTEHILSSVGTQPLGQPQAQKILDILQLIDAQGLLDKVTPVASCSLRALLRDSSQHSLSVIKSAVQFLAPSPRASSDSQFCNLALSLLEQASLQSVEPPTDIQSLFPDDDTPKDPVSIQQKYALVQHLPHGDYWTSLSSAEQLKDLPTAHAELVAIFPYPSSSADVPPLSTCHRIIPEKKQKIPEQRIVSRGSFLDYGLYTSFAPTFDQEAADVGQRQLSEVYYYRETKRRRMEKAKLQHHEEDIQDVTMDDAEPELAAVAVDPELDDLLPPDQISGLRDALQSLDLENSVQELLAKNQRALERLQELQKLRLSGLQGAVEEGSEEWDTAQAILESLTVLASLRPRSSKDDASLIPPPSVLHTLHRALPLFNLKGWYGTLPSGRITALRDDSTAKVRPGSVAQATSTPSTATAAATVAPSLAVPFAGFYNTTNQYRPTTTPQYAPKTVTTPSYYQNPYAGQQANYYGAQGYPGAGATSQQPYSTFTGWFGSYNPPASTGGTGSGRGTPQPTTAAMPFGGYFSNVAAAAAQKSPAVANTVVGKQPQWNVGLYPQQPQPTLPVRQVNGQQ